MWHPTYDHKRGSQTDGAAPGLHPAHSHPGTALPSVILLLVCLWANCSILSGHQQNVQSRTAVKHPLEARSGSVLHSLLLVKAFLQVPVDRQLPPKEDTGVGETRRVLGTVE